MFMYTKLGLQRRISVCRTAAPRTLARYRCMHQPLHCDCTAARLPCVFTLLKIQASINVHVHETLQPAEYWCMVKVCAPWVGHCRVHMYITKNTWQKDQDLGNFHIARLHCILLSEDINAVQTWSSDWNATYFQLCQKPSDGCWQAWLWNRQKPSPWRL